MLRPYAMPGPSSDTIATMASDATKTATTIQRRRDITTFLRELASRRTLNSQQPHPFRMRGEGYRKCRLQATATRRARPLERMDQRHPHLPVRIIGRIDIPGRPAVNRVQRESQPLRQRAFAPDFGQPYRMRVGAVDRFAPGAERSGPYPASDAPAHAERRLPLPVAIRVEVRPVDILFPAFVLPPPQLHVDAVVWHRLPDQARPQMHAVVAVGEALVAGEADRREPLGERVLDAGCKEAVRDRAVDRLLCPHEVTGRNQLDTGIGFRAQSPRDVADTSRMSC